MKFKLLHGSHAEDDKTQYARGSIIETNRDLCAMFNSPGYSPKFEKVAEEAPSSIPTNLSEPAKTQKNKEAMLRKADEEQFKSMTKEELLSYCKEQSIEVKAADKKDDIVAAILLHIEQLEANANA